MSPRQSVLTTLRDAANPLTVLEIAQATGTPASTVRFHLRSLADDGLVKVQPAPSRGRGRPRLRYTARSAMDPSGPRHYRTLARALGHALSTSPDGPRRAAAAGRELGQESADPAMTPVADMIHALDGMGFAPLEEDDGRIRLRHCPFLEIATEQPQITCALHRGLMQGILDAHDSGREVVELNAFVDADHCLAVLD